MKNQMVILRVKDVISRLKIGKSTLYDWLNHKSPRFKGDFPRPVKISETMVGWLEDEINNWLETKKIKEGKRSVWRLQLPP
ncbi:helix-turn-helix transcriptional regulator [Providencia hangzhouensis]|uniref:helix-turn-helix transcriptional regulator n=1 Tax=Providencia hangzhouensis TaxID=3031799 RepID=UPI0034DD31F3